MRIDSYRLQVSALLVMIAGCDVATDETGATSGALCTIEDQDSGFCTIGGPPVTDFLLSTGDADLNCGENLYVPIRLHPNDHIAAGVELLIQASIPQTENYGVVNEDVLTHWSSVQVLPGSTNLLIDSMFPTRGPAISQCLHGHVAAIYRRSSRSVLLVFSQN